MCLTVRRICLFLSLLRKRRSLALLRHHPQRMVFVSLDVQGSVLTPTPPLLPAAPRSLQRLGDVHFSFLLHNTMSLLHTCRYSAIANGPERVTNRALMTVKRVTSRTLSAIISETANKTTPAKPNNSQITIMVILLLRRPRGLLLASSLLSKRQIAIAVIFANDGVRRQLVQVDIFKLSHNLDLVSGRIPCCPAEFAG